MVSRCVAHMKQDWRRTLYVVTGAEMTALLGFMVVIPFLPYYVQELGVSDPDQVKFWSGWLFSGTAISMAVMAPIWGSLADRFGRKLMVERALFGGALVFTAMGFAQTVEQLLVLRIIQGLLTGTVSAATALVASHTPREQSGYALGLLQTGIYLGNSLGPLLGGLVADSLGYRPAFWITGALIFLAGLAVRFMVDEQFTRPELSQGKGDTRLWDGLLVVLRSPILRAVFLTHMLARLSARVVGPMLPLFLEEISSPGVRLATMAGLITGAGAGASAIGAFLLGSASDRTGQRKMLVWCTFGLSLAYLPQGLTQNPLQLALLQVIAGFLMAGVLASVSALLARLVPEGRHGAVYGLSSTTVAIANAIGPLVGASIAVWWGLRDVFTVTAVLFSLAGGLALWLLPMPGKPTRSA